MDRRVREGVGDHLPDLAVPQHRLARKRHPLQRVEDRLNPRNRQHPTSAKPCNDHQQGA